MKDKFIFEDDNGNEIEFRIIEETKFQGNNYLLLENENEECLILKDSSLESDEYSNYELVSEEEAEILFDVFNELFE